MGKLYHIINICGLASFLLVFHVTLNALQGPRDNSVFEAVHTGALGLLGFIVYYPFYDLFKMLCLGDARQKRDHLKRSGSPYNSWGGGDTEIVHGVPKLNMESVWILVYGLGFIFFVCCYSFTGLHPSCLVCLVFGLSIVGIDEILQDTPPKTVFQKAGQIGLVMCSLVATMVISLDSPGGPLIDLVLNLDVFSFMCGGILPIMACMLLIIVKEQRRYTLGNVYELCEFGLPFACILAVMFLMVSDGQSIRIITQNITESNSTDYGELLVTHRSILGVPFLIPLILTPAVLIFMASVMQHNCMDPLLAMFFVSSLMYMNSRMDSSLAIGVFVVAVLTIFMRVISVDDEAIPKDLSGLREPNRQLDEAALEMLPPEDA